MIKTNCKLSKTVFHFVRCIFFISLTVSFSSLHAVSWSESVDAGELLNTAQTPTGSGTIDIITGTITTNFDADLYKIRINDPATFSAFVFNGEGSNDWDSWLMLFDSNGLGLYRNDDAVFDIGDSGLPASHALGPQIAGDYFLAISDDNRAPLSGSASSINDIIFPVSTFPFTEISGSTGSGGNLPLAGWGSLQNEVTLNANYGITLTGAEFVVMPVNPVTPAISIIIQMLLSD